VGKQPRAAAPPPAPRSPQSAQPPAEEVLGPKLTTGVGLPTHSPAAGARPLEGPIDLEAVARHPAWAEDAQELRAKPPCPCGRGCTNPDMDTLQVDFPCGILHTARGFRVRAKHIAARVAFESSLSLEDREAFRAGRRLTARRRAALLGKLSPEEIKQQGLRYSDEEVTAPGPAPEEQDKAREVRESVPARSLPVSIDPWAALQALWHTWTTDRQLLELDVLADGLLNGFNFCYNGPRSCPRVKENHKSARDNPAILAATLMSYVEKGHTRGPYPSPPWPNLICNPAGLREKDGGAWRLVEDPSFGDEAIHDDTDVIEQSYCKFRDVLEKFAKGGRLVYFLKWDKHEAYRSLRIRLQDQWLTGLFVPGLGYFYSPTMPFGFRPSSYWWNRIMAMLIAVIEQKLAWPAGSIDFWVDDSVLVLSACATEAEQIRDAVVDTAIELHCLMHPKKGELARKVCYLGVELDSRNMTVSIPPAKRQRAAAALAEGVKATWTKDLLQRILGHARHLANCLPAAAAFMGRLLKLLKLCHSKPAFQVSAGVRAEVRAWEFIVREWSGTSLLRVRLPSFPPATTWYVDAFGGSGPGDAGDFAGVAAYSPTTGQYTFLRFTERQRRMVHVEKTYSTLAIEFSALPVLLATFCGVLAGGLHRVFIDNDAARFAAIRGYSSDEIVSSLCRVMARMTVRADVHLRYERCDSQQNLADLISRGEEQKFLAEIASLSLPSVPCFKSPCLPDGPSCDQLHCPFFTDR